MAKGNQVRYGIELDPGIFVIKNNRKRRKNSEFQIQEMS